MSHVGKKIGRENARVIRSKAVVRPSNEKINLAGRSREMATWRWPSSPLSSPALAASASAIAVTVASSSAAGLLSSTSSPPRRRCGRRIGGSTGNRRRLSVVSRPDSPKSSHGRSGCSFRPCARSLPSLSYYGERLTAREGGAALGYRRRSFDNWIFPSS